MAISDLFNRKADYKSFTEIPRKPSAQAIQPNVIDRLVNFFNPVEGVRRMAARKVSAVYGSYVGARYDRRATKEWNTAQGSADADTLYDLWTLRRRSRDLMRNTPIALGAVNTVVQNAVGTGLSLQPTPEIDALGWTEEQGAAWATEVEREWRLWSESTDCDVTRTQNFYGLQELALRSCLESGDVFALLPFIKRDRSPYELAVQLVEADRVMNPLGTMEGLKLDSGNQRWGGVEVDQYGAPVAYTVFRKHPGAPDFMAGGSPQFDVVKAFGQKTGRRNVLHLFDRKRPDQKRGVPYLAPVIEPLKQLDRYTEAEVMAAVVSAMFTVFVKTDLPGDGLAQTSDAATPSSTPDTELKLAPGSVLDLAPGEDVTFADPKRPNAAFDPFVLAVLRQIGVALELPFEILVKHFTASYSAARAAMLEAWKFYKNRRNFIATGFCQPAFEAWMEEAVAIGRVNAPGFFADPLLRRAYLRADWIGDAPGSIDPQKEVTAAQARVDMGISTLTDETMSMTGKVWTDVHRTRVREHAMRVKDGLEAPIVGPQTLTTANDAEQPAKPKPGQPAQDDGGSDLEKPEEA